LRFTFGSLFSGIGGIDLGLTRAGMECRWQVEKDPHALGVLARHWPGVPRFRDIRDFPAELREGLDVDLICGGDPCQGNSKAGGVHKRAVEDLGSHFLRVIDALRPRFVLRENPSSTRADAPWPWWRFRDRLESLGYAVLPFRLRSCCLGLDHRRERLFLLAELPDPDGLGLAGLDRDGLAARHAGRAGCDRGGDAGHHRLSLAGIRRAADGLSAGLVRRRLTGLGNAVPPDMAEYIGRRLLAAQERED
jgi:DNA (cytosine-5)-methyltransferase 1